MTSYSDACNRWVRRMQGETHLRELRSSSVIPDGDRLYSFGTHFELARPLRDRKGKVTGYLLNGQRFSARTGQHQSAVRNALRDVKVPVVIIPHPALEQAGVELSTVQVINVSKDTFETKRHRSTEIPEGARWRSEDVWENQEPTELDYANALAQGIVDAKKHHEYRLKLHTEKPEVFQDPGPFEPPTREDIRVHSKRVKVGQTQKLFSAARSWREIKVTETPDGPVYEWETWEHRLGESLIRARVEWRDWSSEGWEVHRRWAYFLSGFDHQESTPLYFFCELPRGSKPKTVAEAYEVLKPDPVKMAEQMGRKVSRQGDIFAVPTRLDRKTLKAMGARIEKRTMAKLELSPVQRVRQEANLPYILKTNHTATEVAYLPNGVTMARGVLYHDPQDREQDHVRRRMGDGASWHIVIKNTVPTAGRR